jgi:hypothetical protein
MNSCLKVRCITVAVIAFCLVSTALQAQTKQLLPWASDLAYLRNASGDEFTLNSAGIAQIRDELELWLRMQPEKKYQGDVAMGTGSANALLSSVNLGSKWQKF